MLLDPLERIAYIGQYLGGLRIGDRRGSGLGNGGNWGRARVRPVALFEYGLAESLRINNSDDIDQCAAGGGGLPGGFDLEPVDAKVAHDRALEELEIGDFFERDRGFGLVPDALFDVERIFGELTADIGKVFIDEEVGDDRIENRDRYGDDQDAEYDDRLPYPVGFDLGIELGFTEDSWLVHTRSISASQRERV